MELKSFHIVDSPKPLPSGARIAVGAGAGMSFVLGALLSIFIKTHSSHAVNQPSCHSEHHNDKISRISTLVQQCKRCGHLKDKSAFASKGRDRLGALCKDCDNHRRRSSYAPKVTALDWDHVTVNIELVQRDQNQIVPLIWEVLVDQKVVGDGTTNFKEETLDSLLNRRSAIDGIIERGST